MTFTRSLFFLLVPVIVKTLPSDLGFDAFLASDIPSDEALVSSSIVQGDPGPDLDFFGQTPGNRDTNCEDPLIIRSRSQKQ